MQLKEYLVNELAFILRSQYKNIRIKVSKTEGRRKWEEEYVSVSLTAIVAMGLTLGEWDVNGSEKGNFLVIFLRDLFRALSLFQVSEKCYDLEAKNRTHKAVLPAVNTLNYSRLLPERKVNVYFTYNAVWWVSLL